MCMCEMEGGGVGGWGLGVDKADERGIDDNLMKERKKERTKERRKEERK